MGSETSNIPNLNSNQSPDTQAQDNQLPLQEMQPNNESIPEVDDPPPSGSETLAEDIAEAGSTEISDNQRDLQAGSETSDNQRDQTTNNASLGERLTHVFRCPVCLEVPEGLPIHQCTRGHLMCKNCIDHLLADAMLGDRTARCPTCRCDISNWRGVTRNHAVERSVKELPATCDTCGDVVCRADVKHHMKHECRQRRVPCKFAPIGCPAELPEAELGCHEAVCQHKDKSGSDVMAYLQEKDLRAGPKLDPMDLINFMSIGERETHDLALKAYYDESLRPQMYYQTRTRFEAFDLRWRLTVNIDSNPPGYTVRQLSYRLDVQNPPDNMTVSHLLLASPGHPLPFTSTVHHTVYSDSNKASTDIHLSMSITDVNAVLAASDNILHVRLMIAKP